VCGAWSFFDANGTWQVARISVAGRKRLGLRERLGILNEGHAEEIGGFPGTTVAIFFIEPHGALEWFGGIERDARTPFGEQVFFDGVQQALRDAATLPFRRYGHSTQVTFHGGDRSAADGSDNL